MSTDAWLVVLIFLTCATLTLWTFSQKETAEQEANDATKQAAAFALEVDDWRRKFRQSQQFLQQLREERSKASDTTDQHVHSDVLRRPRPHVPVPGSTGRRGKHNGRKNGRAKKRPARSS